MTSSIARSNTTNGSPDFKIVLHVKLLTALRTLSQLVRCFRKTVLLTLYSGTDWSIRSTELTSSDLKCIVKYQRPNLLCQGHQSSQDRVCYPQCECDSAPTAHNLTDCKNQEHHVHVDQYERLTLTTQSDDEHRQSQKPLYHLLISP